MDAGALLLCITSRGARFFFIRKVQEFSYFFNREMRSFIPNSQIEELSYSLLNHREASYSLLTNRKFSYKRIEKFSYSFANGHKIYLNPY